MRREVGPQALLGAALAAVVVGPLTRTGWLLLLDWNPGPNVDVGRGAHGLQGSLTAAIPGLTALGLLGELFGAAIGWIPIAAAVGLAVFAMARFVGGGPARWVPAGVLYGFNPVIFERAAAGQVLFLLGYALLPLAARSAVEGARSGRVIPPALWLTGLTGLAVHFAWIGGLLYAAVAVVLLAERGWRAPAWLAAVVSLTFLTSIYLWLPLIGAKVPFAVTRLDLTAYRTESDHVVGLYGNVIGLYGFWRTGEVRLPKDDVIGWPIFALAILIVVVVGLVTGWRNPTRCRAVRVLTVAAPIAFVLALGDQGPAGSAFRLAFDRLPGFAVMREPQKFVVLIALTYALGFGLGVEHLTRGVTRQRARAAAVAGLAALAILYTPTLAIGLAGRVGPVHYPSSWAEADLAMGAGDGRVLFLPWHQYLRFGFSRRIVANPAANVFSRDVISGDNVELPGLSSSSSDPRSAYLQFLYARGPDLCAFGDLVAPLGVEYVVLARTVDFPSYAWLERQVDLQVALDRPEIVVYRNLRYRGVGYRVDHTTTAADWDDVIVRSRRGEVSHTAVEVRSPTAGALPPGGCDPVGPAPAGADVRELSPVAYRVNAGSGADLVLGVPYDRSWKIDGQHPRMLVGGAMGFRAPPAGGIARFEHWTRVRSGYLVSGALVLGLSAIALAQARSRRSRPDPHSTRP